MLPIDEWMMMALVEHTAEGAKDSYISWSTLRALSARAGYRSEEITKARSALQGLCAPKGTVQNYSAQEAKRKVVKPMVAAGLSNVDIQVELERRGVGRVSPGTLASMRASRKRPTRARPSPSKYDRLSDVNKERVDKYVTVLLAQQEVQ